MPSLTHSTNHSPNADPRAAVVLGDHEEHQRRQQQPAGRDGVGPRRQLRPRRPSLSPSLSGRGAGRDQIGPERVDDLDRRRTPPPAHHASTCTTPSISGASRWLRATPVESTSTRCTRADQVVAPGGGDRVLQLAQLGEPLVHQRRRRPRRRGRPRTCRPRRSRRRTRTSRAAPPRRIAAAGRDRPRSRPGSRR